MLARKSIVPIAVFLIAALIVVSGILVFHLIREAPSEIPHEWTIPQISFQPTYPVSLENYYYLLSDGNIDMVRVEFMNHSDMDMSGTLRVYIFHEWMAPDRLFFASPEMFSMGESLTITIPARSRESYVVDIEDVPFQWIEENKSVGAANFRENKNIHLWSLLPVA